MMSMQAALSILPLLLIVALAGDPCNVYATCDACVAAPFCGWCSTPVIYQDHAKGFQCAGLANGSDPFICNGIYSTEVCIQGYVCNITTYQCDLTAPGGGQPLNVCESNCSSTGKTFVCNNTTHTCEIAPAGQGTSLEQCEKECAVSTSMQPTPSGHTASPNPVPPPPPPSPTPTSSMTFVCNVSTMKCDPSSAGHGSSLSVCQESCQKHNVTPPALLGLWRTFPIAPLNAVQEYDVDFTADNKVKIHTPQFDSVCDVQTIGDRNIVLSNCVSPEPPTVKCLFESSPTMPETYEAMMACNNGEGDAPTSFTEAMENGKRYTVIFMSKCVPDGFCKFYFGPPPPPMRRNARLGIAGRGVERRGRSGVRSLGYSDPCEAYGANCTFCLAHAYCGWCSANVKYSDGSEGNQCAGFNPDPTKKNPFQCMGTYSTEQCLPGWVCEPLNQTCVPTTPGSGIPSKEACDTSCSAKPGPPSILLGEWRGLMTSNLYPYGVFTVSVNATTIVVKLQSQVVLEGTLSNSGGTVYIKLTSGPNKGGTQIGMYSTQQNSVVQYITITFGGVNAPEPANYKVGMRSPNIELVLAKCILSNCTF